MQACSPWLLHYFGDRHHSTTRVRASGGTGLSFLDEEVHNEIILGCEHVEEEAAPEVGV